MTRRAQAPANSAPEPAAPSPRGRGRHHGPGPRWGVLPREKSAEKDPGSRRHPLRGVRWSHGWAAVTARFLSNRRAARCRGGQRGHLVSRAWQAGAHQFGSGAPRPLRRVRRLREARPRLLHRDTRRRTRPGHRLADRCCRCASAVRDPLRHWCPRATRSTPIQTRFDNRGVGAATARQCGRAGRIDPGPHRPRHDVTLPPA